MPILENQGLQSGLQNSELEHFSKGKGINTESTQIYCKERKKGWWNSLLQLPWIHCIGEVEWNSLANSGSCKSQACAMALNYSVRNKNLKPVSGINNWKEITV